MTFEHAGIEVRANSKTILTGENAVVFGATSVACAVGLENACRIDTWENAFFRVSVGPIVGEFDKTQAVNAFNAMKQLCENKSYQDVATALKKHPLVWIRAVLGKLVASGEDFPYFSAAVELALPLGSGLGGSSTSTILILKAVGVLRGRPFSRPRLFDLAYLGDQIAHGGSASGTDSGTLVFGGFISFRQGEGVKLIKEHLPLELLICGSGRNEASGTSLSILRRRRARHPDRFDRRISQFDALSRELVELISRSDVLDIQGLGVLMNKNQRLLQEMGVSTPEIDHLVQTADARGALGAKLTGGGCGGVVIVVGERPVLRNIADEFAAGGRRVLLTSSSPSEGHP